MLEATTGASALRKRGVVDRKGETKLRDAIIDKFKTNVIDNTVAPRKLAKMARAVERGDLTLARAKKITSYLTERPSYSIENAFDESVARIEVEHAASQLADRLFAKLEDLKDGGELNDRTVEALTRLLKRIRELL